MSGAVRIVARDRRDLLGEGPVWSARERALTLEPLRIEPIVDPEPDRPQNRLNDAKADHCGRIWAGPMPVAANEPSGCLYCLDVDRTVTRVDSGYTVANGPALNPDGDVLYHTDSARRVIYKFQLHEDGTLSDRAPFIEFQTSWGQPDGMTVDRDGGLWVAHYGASRVSRFYDDGRVMTMQDGGTSWG